MPTVAGGNLPGSEWVPFPSNAEAARRVGEGDLDAALASASAADRYGLAVLVPEVHDRSNAMTRFVEVAPPGSLPAPTGAGPDLARRVPRPRPRRRADGDPDRVRGARHQPVHDPVPADGDGLGSYFFFIDCEGHIDDTRVGEAMMGVRRVCAEVRFLGSYPRSDGGRTHVRPGTSDPEFADAGGVAGGALRYGLA